MESHTERMRVNWVDTDASGLIHYTAALRYFEVAEHALMRKLWGAGGAPGQRAFSLPRVHVECDYKAPLRYPDEFDCTARVDRVGTSSIHYAYECRRPNGELCLVGRIIAVAIDQTGRSMPIPDAMRRIVAPG